MLEIIIILDSHLLKSMETISYQAKLLFLDRKLYSYSYSSIRLTDFELKIPPKIICQTE